MACELGAAGANEPASLGRHAPLPINATARVPDPPICADVISGPVVALAAQMWAFGDPSGRIAVLLPKPGLT